VLEEDGLGSARFGNEFVADLSQPPPVVAPSDGEGGRPTAAEPSNSSGNHRSGGRRSVWTAKSPAAARFIMVSGTREWFPLGVLAAQSLSPRSDGVICGVTHRFGRLRLRTSL
jgi:hypothetical protein